MLIYLFDEIFRVSGAALTAIETGSKIAVPKRAAASIKKSKFDSSSPVLIQNPNFLAAKAQSHKASKSKMTAGSKAAPATVPTGKPADKPAARAHYG